MVSRPKAVGIMAAALLVAASASVAPAGQLLYQSDFATDPGWQTNSPADYYWNSATQALALKMQDATQSYYTTPITYAGQSFKLDFDITVTASAYAGDIDFGLLAASRTAYEHVPYTGPQLALNFSQGDLGNGVYVSVIDQAGHQVVASTYPSAWEVNTPYHARFFYNANAHTVIGQVTRISDGQVLQAVNLSGVMGMNGLAYLGASKIGDDYAPGAFNRGTVDNVKLKTVGHAWQDDFQDGVINPALWATGGAHRGVGGYASGSYAYGFTEGAGNLRVRLQGPGSGDTYGADAWVRTTYDYNDGANYVLNFRWGATVNASHIDAAAIQITDGVVDTATNNLYWWLDESAGRKNLFWTASDLGLPAGHNGGMSNMPPTDWSVFIDATTQAATLYDGPNLSGNVIGQKTLDPNLPWYLQFVWQDATSAGYPATDNSLYLYSMNSQVVPEPASFLLLGAGVLLGLRRGCRK